jgi:3-oxoacyl-[acyl-carrier protein] reductase
LESDRSVIDLGGKVALVTGGSRGIGAATAQLLARAGACVAITYRAREDAAQAVVSEIEGTWKAAKGAGKAAHAVAIRADLSTSEANRRVVDETVQAFGRLDCFVANAGIWPVDPVAVSEMPEDQWRRTIATNLDSVFYGCRAALAVMSGGGAIVIVASTAGQRGEGFHADYAASKGAVISFVKSLAVEVAPGITVNAVAPGWVETDMVAAALQSADSSKILDAIPLRRVAQPEDIAGPIVFLCSPLARHITGEILNVNGGSVLCG